jgi:3-hydroxyacyl-CoA dehydrogenase
VAIKTVGVVGCGLMGSGIAQVCAEAGYQVLVREVDEGFLKKGLGNIDRFLAKGVEKGKVTPERKAEVLGRLKGTTDLARMGECDLVIEVVTESLDVKRRCSRPSTPPAVRRRSSPPTRRPSPSRRWRRPRSGRRASSACTSSIPCP